MFIIAFSGGECKLAALWEKPFSVAALSPAAAAAAPPFDTPHVYTLLPHKRLSATGVQGAKPLENPINY